ncbi:MAG: zinc ribbon domain-containing protein [Candidatus Heimdallarchaeaceae archaeon]
MISDSARKNIALSSMVYIGLIFILSFVNSFSENGSFYMDLLSIIVLDLTLLWLGYGIYIFSKDEKSKTMLKSAIFIMSGAGINIITSFIGILDQYRLVPLNTALYYLNGSIQALTFGLFVVAFYLLRDIMNQFVRQQRNVFGGQTSLPLGFFFYFIYAIMVLVKNPYDFIYTTDEGKLAFVPGTEAYVATVFFTQIIFSIMVIIGFWNLRRAILILDKIPKELFEIVSQRKQPMYSPIMPPSMTYTNNQDISKLDTELPPTSDSQVISAPTSLAPIQTTATTTSTPKKQKKFCIKCGLELEDDAQYCPHCGAKNPYI